MHRQVDRRWGRGQPISRFLAVLLIVGVCSGAFFHTSSEAAEFSIYRSGLLLLKAKQFQAAGAAWLDVGQTILQSRRDTSALKQTAFAYVLASMAFEHAKDDRAYMSWGLAIQYYQQGKTSWEAERTLLTERLDTMLGHLKAARNADLGSPSIDEEALLLMDLAEGLALTTYSGPQPGLLHQPADAPRPTEAQGQQGDYYARPLAVIAGMQQPVTQSRHAFSDEEVEASSHFLGRRTDTVADMETDTASEQQRNTQGLSDPEPAVPERLVRRSVGPRTTGAPLTDKQTNREQVMPRSAHPEAEAEQAEQDDERGEPSSPAFVVSTEMRSSAETPAIPRLTNGGGGLSGQGLSRSSAFAKELRLARLAWQYFVTNQQTNTGLFNAVHGTPETTMWDLGSGLAGLVCAEQLGIINRERFQKSLNVLLQTLTRMSLYNQELPNRQYDARTGSMIDAKHRSSKRGSGWSALDLGRLLVWLKITATWYPAFEERVEAVIERWQLSRLLLDDELQSLFLGRDGEYLRQAGRLGYEQYAALGFRLWGLNAPAALDYEETQETEVFGVSVSYDIRDNACLTSEPFFLAKIELGGIDPQFDTLTQAVYEVQRRRWQELDVLTAVSEDFIDKPPGFVYNCIVFDGRPWQSVGSDGQQASSRQSLSTKAAFAWFALYPDDYSKQLAAAVENVIDPGHGYYAGVYTTGKVNTSLNITTNAGVLEALLYIVRGRRPFISLAASSTPAVLAQHK